MEEIKEIKRAWDDQLITVPLKFVLSMKEELFETKHSLKELREHCNELETNLKQAKIQIRDLIGMGKESERLADLRFEKGVKDADD